MKSDQALQTGLHDVAPLCVHCVFDSVFEHDGIDPINKKGFWKAKKRLICIYAFSLEFQRNQGSWQICDTEFMQKCSNFAQNSL